MGIIKFDFNPQNINFHSVNTNCVAVAHKNTKANQKYAYVYILYRYINKHIYI